MNEGIIGFIIMIIALNVVSRILRSVGNARKQAKKESPSGSLSFLQELAKKIDSAGLAEKTTLTETQDGDEQFGGLEENTLADTPDDTTFSTFEESTRILDARSEEEFIEHPLSSEFSELTPWSEDIFEKSDKDSHTVLAGSVATDKSMLVVGKTPFERKNLPQLVHLTELQRAIVLSSLLGPCRAMKYSGRHMRHV